MVRSSFVPLFLQLLKRFVEKNSFILVERSASLQFMVERGMSIPVLTDIILSPTPEDCFDGPEPDRDPRYAEHWTVAEFAPVYNNERLYLKMSIRTDNERAKCLSVKAYVERLG